jgi:hypothetical protein
MGIESFAAVSLRSDTAFTRLLFSERLETACNVVLKDPDFSDLCKIRQVLYGHGLARVKE